MVKAGKKFIHEEGYTLSFGDADFHLTERIGSPWTVVLANGYKTITLDFGKHIKWNGRIYWKSHRYTSVIFSESLKSTSWKVCSAESSQVKGVQRPKRVMIQQNTPTNELIEVIQEISHEFTVGFPFNTRVTTLNHSV